MKQRLNLELSYLGQVEAGYPTSEHWQTVCVTAYDAGKSMYC